MGITAKIFIGMEYECPRGHRFISASLDKATRTAKDSGSGSKFVHNDVPLYLPCPCRGQTSRPLVAQLMRIHVVTPKAPVKVLFSPVVVPCPNGPHFHQGWTSPPEMPVHAYWILRLPFIYCGMFFKISIFKH
jgi:protein SMG8